MKIRKGFVSNSSSSSFVCDISGETECGYDLSMSDAGMYECVKGHTFMDEYLLEPERLNAMIDKAYEEDNFEYEDIRYELPSEFCPVCQFKEVISDEAVLYLLKKCGIDMKQLKDEIKGTYISYDLFKEDLNR